MIWIVAIAALIYANDGYAWDWPTWNDVKALFSTQRPNRETKWVETLKEIETPEGPATEKTIYPKKPSIWQKMQERAWKQRYQQPKAAEVRFLLSEEPTQRNTYYKNGRVTYEFGGGKKYSTISQPAAFSGEAKQQFKRTQTTE